MKISEDGVLGLNSLTDSTCLNPCLQSESTETSKFSNLSLFDAKQKFKKETFLEIHLRTSKNVVIREEEEMNFGFVF